ncbi:hypothetical protein [Streptomyces sp. NPDC058572]|uniref:hypothetical protein n=1 Tax=Streptomyces sp. NPDC058572 TaxID=3346546 RepID=UPI003669A4FC
MKLVPRAGDACAALALGLVVLSAVPAQADPTGPTRAIACDTEALKDAIDAANAARGGTIQLARRCTYTLTAEDNNGPHGSNGLPLITTPITLKAGKNTVIERSAAAPAFRIFEVTGPAGALTLDGTDRGRRPGDRWDDWNTANALLTGADRGDRDRACRNGSGLTVRGGSTTGSGGAVFVDDDRSLTLHCVTLTDNTAVNGGAVRNRGTTDLRASTLSGNSAEHSGGAISSRNGKLSLIASRLNENAAGDGGGLTVEGGSATVSASLIDHNTASNAAGILVTNGVVDIVRSIIRHNTATRIGGGLAVVGGGSVNLRHSSVSENTARQAGGIQDQTRMVIEDSKVNKNTATTVGGGIVVILGDMTIRRSEVNENRTTAGPGGGIVNVNTLALDDVEVLRNYATAPAGGVQNNASGTVTVSGQTRITDNTPTNCAGSATPVPGCAG